MGTRGVRRVGMMMMRWIYEGNRRDEERGKEDSWGGRSSTVWLAGAEYLRVPRAMLICGCYIHTWSKDLRLPRPRCGSLGSTKIRDSNIFRMTLIAKKQESARLWSA